LGELNTEVVVSPQWLDLATERESLVKVLGSERAALVGDYRPLLAAGVPVSYGSDWPVSEPNLRLAIESAVNWLGNNDPQAYATHLAITLGLLIER
jgi:predicted amidohydrolase YtcJ